MKRIAAALSLVAAATVLHVAPADASPKVCAKQHVHVAGHGKATRTCITHR